MSPLHLCFSLTLLSICLPGQGTSFATAPPGYLSRGGDTHCTAFGSSAHGRLQIGEPSLRGRVRDLRRVDLRLADVDYGGESGIGRTWTRVSLQLAATDTRVAFRNFSQNILGSPTEVFAGGITWPTLSGRPPQPGWGTPVGFGFGQPHRDLGTADLLLDWRFSGGRLLDNSNWLLVDKPYPVDAAGIEGVTYARHLATRSLGPCAVSSPYLYWSNAHRDSRLATRDETTAWTRLWGGAAQKPAFIAVGDPLPQPQFIAALCEPLYLLPYHVDQGVSVQRGFPPLTHTEFKSPTLRFATQPAFFEHVVALQAAYVDQQDFVRLTPMVSMRLPGPPPPPAGSFAVHFGGSPLGNPSRGTSSRRPLDIPLLRFAF